MEPQLIKVATLPPLDEARYQYDPGVILYTPHHRIIIIVSQNEVEEVPLCSQWGKLTIGSGKKRKNYDVFMNEWHVITCKLKKKKGKK